MPSLLRKLDAFLMSSIYELGDEMQNDFRFLRAELDAMDTFLRKMSEIEEHCKQAQRQAVVVRDLSYDIEDRMDRLMLLESSDRGEIIAKEIRSIMKLIDEVKERHSKYTKQIDNEMETISIQIPADPRPRFLYADVSELVGIEVLMDDLIFMLTCGEDEGRLLQRMVSIVGFGGSGKTTLAKQLYQELGPQFDCCAFVSVSRKPNISWTLRSMLCQIQNDLCAYAEAWDENQLIDEIMDFLQDKRYATPVRRTKEF
ncbi:hypothetical protein PR202_gb08392 [Eleusine coracana subsp. coracana]|uniref:Uncharacterized protein n=1 Tax=Eleusine coracana subsp. coracana TaxID=191504 RepID=A0AAV5EEG8_ELECO|nr:hypothetical protein PR202_gb08392 [Eleusine coracana subsp. coracana]